MCERFRDVGLIFGRQRVVRIHQFIIVERRLRLVSHIEIIDRQSLVDIGQILSHAVVHETEPAIDRGRIELHIFVNIRDHHIRVPVPAVEIDFFVRETEGGEIIPLVVIFHRPFPETAFAEINFHDLPLSRLHFLFSP